MKPWSKALYLSREWKRTRDAYMDSQNGLCERCGHPAQIVHHKIHLTARNIHDPKLSLSWDNLEAICRECHAIEHQGTQPTAQGLMFDKNGNVVKTPERGKREFR